MFGNVKVNYNPCKSKVAVERTAHYILGKLPQQIKDGVIKTAPNLYWGINCDRDNFPRDVMMTRKLFGKRNSGNANLSYQISISFSPDDRDKLANEEVFRIAKDFAEKFFQGYEVLFAVHIDKPHPHAHFLIGNCHTVTGKAFRRNERDLYNMCEYLGEQCQKRGLVHSMREEYYNHDLDDSPDKETFAEKQMKAKGKETFKDELREVIRIECADPNNKTLEDVVNALMKHYHVECRVKGNTISYRHPKFTDKNGKLVSVRGSKLGDKYTVKGINYELGKNQRGRETDRDEVLTAANTRTAVIIDSAGGRGDIGENRQDNTTRNDSSVQSGKPSTTSGTGRTQDGKQIRSTGDTGATTNGIQAGDSTGTDTSTGDRQHQGESTSTVRSLGSEHSECQSGREGPSDGIGSSGDVRSFEDLFREYEQRNGTPERKRKPQPEPARDVRKNRRKRNEPGGR